MYRKASEGWAKHLDFMILDIVCLHISFLLAYFMYIGIENPYASPVYRNMGIVLTLIDIVIITFLGLFKDVLKRGYYKEFAAAVKQVCFIELFATFYLFAAKAGAEYSRVTLYLMALIYIIVTYIARLFWKFYLKKKRFRGGDRALLVVTGAKIAESVVKNIKNNNYEGFHIVGLAVASKNLQGKVIAGVPVVADQDTVANYVRREWVDEVFINLPMEEPYPDELINQFIEMGVVVHMKLARSSNLLGKQQFVEQIGNYAVLTTSINYATMGQLFLKRVMDIFGGIVGCLITGILYIILAPIIRSKSPGPVFFKQTRVGKNGKQFQMYKFRSMYMDAEERKKELMAQNRVKDGMMFKLDWDPRIIGSKKLPNGVVKKGVGNFIRDWSLDEFPQFINVLKGDMSLVGTRPPTVDEWEKYDLHHRARLATKPGVTGMWQISGRSNITDFEEVVKLDKKYISEWNLGLDIKIILKTVGVVFKREGSM